MKRILLASVCLFVAACGPEHVRDEVRQVEVGNTIISDGWTDIIYTSDADFQRLDQEYDPELYVEIIDVESKTTFKVPLGYECSQFPLPRGAQFLTRFEITAYEEKPKEELMSPYGGPLKDHLCS